MTVQEAPVNQSDDEKTVVNYKPGNPAGGFNRPMPGGRGASIPKQAHFTNPDATLSNSQHKASDFQLNTASLAPLHKVYLNPLNPLLANTQPILNEMVDLTAALEEKDIGTYRAQLDTEIKAFEMQCGQVGIDEETLIYARYVLCTVLDELVNKTPWRHKGEWNKHSLLSQYHGETGGGEKFFDLLEHLLIHPAKQLDMLELMFVCLSMGFEGKYHLQPKGHLQLEQIKDNLYQVIRLQRGEAEQQLSPNWQGVSDRRNPVMRYVPAWVFAAITALLLVSMFLGFGYLIEESGDQTVAKIDTLPTSLPANNTQTKN